MIDISKNIKNQIAVMSTDQLTEEMIDLIRDMTTASHAGDKDKNDKLFNIYMLMSKEIEHRFVNKPGGFSI